MTQPTRLDGLARGWRGPLLAAVIALLTALPAVLAMPPLDRDEARFAQATAQMLESGDFVDIRFQDQPRDKKPVGIHWLQALSVSALSSAEDRAIWAFRIPSLLAAMVAAAACAWGATAYFGPGRGLAAGAVLGTCVIFAVEAGLAKTDAVLCASTTLALAALGRIYAQSAGVEGVRTSWRTRLLFWAGMAMALLDKGPIGPMVAVLTGMALWISDRRAPWARGLAWAWGLILVAAVVGPWALAISIKTDGAFWGHAIGGDMAPKLRGGQEGHGAPPGAHLAFLPLLFFPAGALLPAALVQGWTRRAEPGLRFALCWLIPSWIVFEAAPTKLPHYTLPLFAALAWLAVAAIGRPLSAAERWGGAALSLVAGLVWATVAGLAQQRFGDGASLGWALATGLLSLLAASAAAAILFSSRPWPALAGACLFGALAHMALEGGLAPRLSPLWLSPRIVAMLDQAHMNPQGGLTPGPVTVIGYGEPSLVFALGTETELGDAGDGAEAISEGRPVVVEARAEAAFLRELAADRLKARVVSQITGFDYSNGKRDKMILYRSDGPPPQAAPTPVSPASAPMALEAAAAPPKSRSY